MASLENLDGLLQQAGKLLNEAAHEIRDIPLAPEKNIRAIGEVLIRIFEIQRQIYEQRPDLTPPELTSKKE
jgi:hypothetical protein